jgi:hypothetical protein
MIPEAIRESEEKKKDVWKALKMKYPCDYILRKSRTRYLKLVKKNI